MKLFIVALALCSFCLCSSISSVAQNVSDSETFQIGNKQVAIPAPSGFAEAASQVSTVKEVFTATESPGNELLAVHMPVEHLKRFKSGEFFDLTFYTKVSISKQIKNLTVTEANFTDFVNTFKKNFPAFSDPNGKVLKDSLNRISKQITELSKEETTFNLSQPINLGLIINNSNAYGTVLLAKVAVVTNGKEKAGPLLMGISAVRVREKIVFIYTYKDYEKEQDVAELKTFTSNWINQIVRANARIVK